MAPSTAPAERYRLTLRALPSSVPASARMRRLLKAILRGYGFRCERIDFPQPVTAGRIRPTGVEQSGSSAGS